MTLPLKLQGRLYVKLSANCLQTARKTVRKTARKTVRETVRKTARKLSANCPQTVRKLSAFLRPRRWLFEF